MKLRLGLLAVLLAATAMVGCAPTEEDYKNWASENGYVQNPDYAGWASENGYVQNQPRTMAFIFDYNEGLIENHFVNI